MAENHKEDDNNGGTLEYYVSNIDEDDEKYQVNVKSINKHYMQDSKYSPDECFQMKHAQDDHGWIMDYENDHEVNFSSEMKSKFQKHLPPQSLKGARAQLQYRQAVQEVLREMEEEKNQPEEKTDYCTEYDGNYGACIQFKRLTDDKEYFERLKLKYPLYSTQPMTVYRHQYLSYPSGVPESSIPGMTRPYNQERLWNKYGGFTTPIDLLNEEPPGGL